MVDVRGSGIYQSALYGPFPNSLPTLRGRRLDGQVTEATGEESVEDGMPASDIDRGGARDGTAVEEGWRREKRAERDERW